ncbi:MAG: peptide ABC transporter substrate-binding protein [Anaerolineae bacterium]
MINSKWFLAVAIVVSGSLIAACGGAAPAPSEQQPAVAPAQQESQTEAEPVQEEATPTEAEAEPAEETEPSASGNRLILLLSEDLETLNPYLSTAFIVQLVSDAIFDPLAGPDQNGEYLPVLAERVPTQANGDISEDGATITWHLRQDVKWADGTPFTAKDVLFTYEAASSTDSGSVRTSAFENIKSIDAPDDYTVVVTYNEFDANYLDQFQWGILPARAGDAAAMTNWDFNRNAFGTGPFQLQEWVSGDHLTLARNDNYYEAGKPYLDELVFQVVPSEQVRAEIMRAGQAHVMTWPGGDLRAVWDQTPDVEEKLVPGIWIMRMFLNLSAPGDDDPGAEPPHPILGDERVRKALALGIDYNSIVNDLAEGRVVRATSPFALGWYDCNIAGAPYDPDAAKALLEEAGWVDTDGDGIREAQGAMYAEDGTKLSLDMVGYTGWSLLEQTEQVVAAMLKDIGVEVNLSNEEMAVLFGSWADKAPRKMGDYDILMYDTGAYINPQEHISDYFMSSNIPTNENEGVGANYTRWVSQEADELIQEAGRTPDLDDRKALYCQLAELIKDSYSQIFLYRSAEGHAYNTAVTGYNLSTWDSLTWDAENWQLQ